METKDFLDAMWDFYTPENMTAPPCGKCYSRPAVALHHIEPRSVAPEKLTDAMNVIPVCDECHRWVESAGEGGQALLHKRVVERMQAVSEWSDGSRVLWRYIEEENL